MLILGSVKQLTQDAVVQVDDFVGDGGHALGGQRHESGVAPLRLEFGGRRVSSGRPRGQS